jgi:putative hemolysin
LDADPFDAICDHLLVEHVASSQIVGTYRLQMGATAEKNLGYYCDQEFDLSVFEPFRNEVVELGRACVHRQHRNLFVLGLLWKGIADYAVERGGRFLMGCSSLTSQDPAAGASAFTELCRNHLAEPQFRTHPLPSHECPMDAVTEDPTAIPKLLRAYLAVGGKICGPPALDRQFKTIDFLTMLDFSKMTAATRARFFS